MTGDPIDRTLVQPAAEQARDPHTHRLWYLAGALVVAGVLGLALFSWLSIHSLQGHVAAAEGDAHAATSSAQDAAARAKQLYDQVVKLGGTPIVAPPPAPTTGPAGLNGTNGTNGRDGQSPPCLSTPSQCVGAPGVNGQPGTDGQPGQPGTNGVDGQPGQPGKDGANGTDGKDGAPGVSVTRQYFDRDATGQCRNYNDFSDGKTRVDEGPAGDAACAPASPPPTTTPSAVLPTGTTLRRRYP